MINIVIEGVGGQGTLLASRILGFLALENGLEVKVSEVHGMAQRGGSVITHVRMGETSGEKVYSPLVERSGADYLLAFERLEALRGLPYVKPGGVAIVNTQIIPPMPVITGAEEYPANILEILAGGEAGIVAVDALSMAEAAGSARCVNLVLLGILSGLLSEYCVFDEQAWLSAITRSVPPKSFDINRKAFLDGREFSRNIALSKSASDDVERSKLIADDKRSEPDKTADVKAMLRNYYDREASGRNAHDPQEWKNAPKAKFLSYLHDEKKATLLEIGAGTGKDSKFFSDNGLDVTAVDLSPEMVRFCRERGVKALELDFYNLSTLGRTFDAVWSMNSLLHVKRAELPAVLSEVDSVLNPSGLFYMGVYGGEDWEGCLEDEGYGLPRFFSVLSDAALCDILEKKYDIISFNVIATGFGWHFQSVIMRKRS